MGGHGGWSCLFVLLFLVPAFPSLHIKTHPLRPDTSRSPVNSDQHALFEALWAPSVTIDQFLHRFYRNDWLHIPAAQNDLDPRLAAADPWLDHLHRAADTWLAAELPQLVQANALTVRDAQGQITSVPAPILSNWSLLAPRLRRDHLSLVFRREQLDAQNYSVLETTLQAVFGSASTTAHAYLSAPGARALQPHTDPYDVIVVQLAGRKRWRLCTGCLNWPESDLTRFHCQSLWMEPGDVLYLPKAVIHVADAPHADETTSIHLTYSLDREGATWHHLLATAACVTPATPHASAHPDVESMQGSPLCAPVQLALRYLLASDLALPWLQIAYEPLTRADVVCQRLSALVQGPEPFTLQQAFQQTQALAWWSSQEQQLALDELSDCHAVMTRIEQAVRVSNSNKQRREAGSTATTHATLAQQLARVTRDAPWVPPGVSKQAVCNGCMLTQCTQNCQSGSECDALGCDSSCDQVLMLPTNCDGDCDPTRCYSCTQGCQKASCTSCYCPAGFCAPTNDIAINGCQACPPGTYTDALNTAPSCTFCEAATFQPASASKFCLACNTDGKLCPINQHQSSKNHRLSTCTPCDAGTEALEEGMAMCTPIKCDEPPAGPYSMVVDQAQNYSAFDIVQYGCEPLMEFATGETGARQCQSDGSWPVPPTCVPIRIGSAVTYNMTLRAEDIRPAGAVDGTAVVWPDIPMIFTTDAGDLVLRAPHVLVPMELQLSSDVQTCNGGHVAVGTTANATLSLCATSDLGRIIIWGMPRLLTMAEYDFDPVRVARLNALNATHLELTAARVVFHGAAVEFFVHGI
ncbi:uncharacterized protein MONBRDRAFT_28190 [Monosiga brevicollis MX1]|uniref:Bifunctional lysine-specific demethylase and histidyl-hydroxylase n=1 Tax=Monosiga brevicollis TaxID=81824 RepID=A9V7G6_MONBE|nr:uncharacterized protein MONBRDRAFT_28190 [Monosiga brevicollis MX1]EDQ86583.1 predicted protein [Monosiga brevicollis MX1]|eukprot:XP_001748696.1 hypothetical protein [Monosiga brevicollis MX1]